MKKALSIFSCFIFLCSCSSDSKNEVASAGQTVSPGGPSTNEPSKVNCVELNGKYGRKLKIETEDGEPQEVDHALEFLTKIENGVYHYSLNGSDKFLAADGQMKEIQTEGLKGQQQVSCDASSVTVMLKQEDQSAISIKYLALGPSKVRIESENTEAASLVGTYLKE
jgi:hypothetical protein